MDEITRLNAEIDRLDEINSDLITALQSYVTHAEGWERLQPLSFEAQRRLDQARAAIRAAISGETRAEEHQRKELEYLREGR